MSADAAAPVLAEQAGSHEAPLTGLRAVICEDNGLVHLQVRKILSHAGLDIVASARTGPEGVRAALDERPDIVLMDLQLPDMDGFEAAARIMEVYQPCLVMLTAYSDPDCLEKAQSIGAAAYITKPISRDELVSQLTDAAAAAGLLPRATA